MGGGEVVDDVVFGALHSPYTRTYESQPVTDKIYWLQSESDQKFVEEQTNWSVL